MRKQLLKALILAEIKKHKALVHHACQNEMSCFEEYLKQIKSQYEKLPTSQLEALAKGVNICQY